MSAKHQKQVDIKRERLGVAKYRELIDTKQEKLTSLANPI